MSLKGSGVAFPRRLAGLGFVSPRGLVFWTICLGTAIRVAFAASVVDLGHSEAYYIATSRHFALSYFDHPPLSFWIAGATMKLAGSDAILVVRAPFILLFAATTWLLFRLGALLFGEAAGAFAALLLNLSPLFAISLGAWVQPDGPLIFCILAATLCVVRIASGSERKMLLWPQAGLWLGLALLAKYYAALLPAGIALFAATSREHRRWFREPGPYVAGLFALLLFSPVLIWNWQHDWVSFGFQGERVVEGRGISLRWLGDSVLGQAALIGPWIWIPMLLAWAQAVKEGRGNSNSWFLLCAGSVPIVLFTAVALWMPTGGHYHWQAPGYLLLFPLLGRLVIDKLEAGDVFARRWLVGSAAAMLLIAGAIGSEAATGWAHQLLANSIRVGADATLKGLEWKELRPALASRGLLQRQRLFVATAHRTEVGKVDVEIGGSLPVVCLCPDPRDIAFGWKMADFAGWDALIIGTDVHLADPRREYGGHFRSIEPLENVAIHRGGATVLTVRVYYATGYLGFYPLPLATRAR